MDSDSGSDLFPMTTNPALPTFDLALRGYDRRQVDEYLDRLEHDLSVAQADRDAASVRIAATEKRLDYFERELDIARDQLTENEHPTYAGLGKRVEQLLSIAEEEAQQLRADADRDIADERAVAETLIKEARYRADRATREFEASLEARRREVSAQESAALAELDKRLAVAEQHIVDAEGAAEHRLAGAQAEADKLISEATDRSDRVRKEAEQHATAVIQAARHDVERIALEAKSEAETIISDARASAAQARAEHDREIAELVRRRQDIRSQLKVLRQVLGTLPDADGDEDTTDTPSSQDALGDEVGASHSNGSQAAGHDISDNTSDLRKTGS